MLAKTKNPSTDWIDSRWALFENPRILEKIEKEYGVTIVVVNVKKQGS